MWCLPVNRLQRFHSPLTCLSNIPLVPPPSGAGRYNNIIIPTPTCQGGFTLKFKGKDILFCKLLCASLYRRCRSWPMTCEIETWRWERKHDSITRRKTKLAEKLRPPEDQFLWSRIFGFVAWSSWVADELHYCSDNRGHRLGHVDTRRTACHKKWAVNGSQYETAVTLNISLMNNTWVLPANHWTQDGGPGVYRQVNVSHHKHCNKWFCAFVLNAAILK